ncbi:hypothetical protein PMIN04_012922 [Paraphaeosphaeria minitans]|uniref:NmrA family transcriptional regulator protein n=1 Tax=Paraphaeosphaeria minitans TaxID=565426 RepID=A0A9P6G4B3_9PLEO|nr:putative NmrA family transcriptional regulator protein [Paraphaeosphaeria minitans]
MSKIFTVFGATGNQGGSVVEHVLADAVLSKEFKIRGVTRDTSTPAAQKLLQRGVEMVVADMMSKESLQNALHGSHTVFLVTNYWETHGTADEITQGKNVADVAKDVGVQHLIFSSSLNVSAASKGRLTRLPHYDGKAEVEQYIRDSQIPATFYLAGYFMSNLEQFLQKGEDGTLTWSLPTGGNALFPLIAIQEDTGKFVKAIVKRRSALLGARILGAEDYYTAAQIVEIITQVTGKKTQFVQLDEATFKSYMPPDKAVEMLETHLLNADPGYYNGEGLEKSHNILDDKLVSFEEFVRNSNVLRK